MLAVASGQVHSTAGQLPETAFAAGPRPSLAAVIRHGLAVGAAAMVLQILVLLALLYACGVIAS